MRILATKNFLIGGLAALSLTLAGCLTKSDDGDDEPTPPAKLTIVTQPQNQTGAIGDSITISVVATSGNGPIKYKWIATFPSGSGGTESDTLSDSTASIGTILDGDYHGLSLRVVVSDSDTVITSNSITVTVTYAATGDTLTLGAQGSTAGSAIDLDSAGVLTQNLVSANTYARLVLVDLVVLYYNNAIYLHGTKAARDSSTTGHPLFTGSYPLNLAADIKFVAVTSKPASIHVADSLYNAGTKLGAKVIAAGDKFVVKSTEDVYHYLEVRSVSSAVNGNAALTVFAGAIWGDDED